MNPYNSFKQPTVSATEYNQYDRVRSIPPNKIYDGTQPDDKFDESSSITSMSSSSKMSSNSRRTACWKCKESAAKLDDLFSCSSCPARYHRGCHTFTNNGQCDRCIKKSKKIPPPSESAPATLGSTQGPRANTSGISVCEVPSCNRPIYVAFKAAVEKRMCMQCETLEKSKRARLQAAHSSRVPQASQHVNRQKLHPIHYDKELQSLKRKRGPSGKKTDGEKDSLPPAKRPFVNPEKAQRDSGRNSIPRNEPMPTAPNINFHGSFAQFLESKNNKKSQIKVNDFPNDTRRTSKSIHSITSQTKTDNPPNDTPGRLPDTERPKLSLSPEYEPPPPVIPYDNKSSWEFEAQEDDSPGSQIVGELRAMQESTEQEVGPNPLNSTVQLERAVNSPSPCAGRVALEPLDSGSNRVSGSSNRSMEQASIKPLEAALEMTSNLPNPRAQQTGNGSSKSALDGTTGPPNPTKNVKINVRDLIADNASALAGLSTPPIGTKPTKSLVNKATGSSQSSVLHQKSPVRISRAANIEKPTRNAPNTFSTPAKQHESFSSLFKINGTSSFREKTPSEAEIPDSTHKAASPVLSTSPSPASTTPFQQTEINEAKHTAPLYGDYNPQTLEYKRQLRAKTYDSSSLDDALEKQAKAQAQAKIDEERNFIPPVETTAKTQIWGRIDPRKVWPKERSESWYEAKRKEIDARGGKKARMGVLVTRQVREERAAKGWHPNQNQERRSNSEVQQFFEALYDLENLDLYEPVQKDGKLYMREPMVVDKKGKKRKEGRLFPADNWTD